MVNGAAESSSTLGGPGEAELLLAGLDAEQRRAAETLLGPVGILAGAGTGKTRAITHRIAYGVASGVYAPERVLALSFTVRAAGELRTRLSRLGARGVQSRTFHSAALAQLGYFWPQVVGGRAPGVLSTKGSVLGQAADALRLRLDRAALRDVAAEIEWRKVNAMTPTAYERAAHSRELPAGLGVATMLELQDAYERIKDERRQLDFEDVLLSMSGMLEAEPAVAARVREQYRFFVVDEYQDVSPLQQRMLELWLGPRTDLCVVGDLSQTIFSFAGASSEFLLGFAARWEGAQIIRLERNYRSTPAVLAAANRLMRGRPGALELRAAEPRRGPTPSIRGYESEAEEVDAVAAEVADEVAAGTRPERIAVLFRIGAQAGALEQALTARGLSTRPLGGARFFDHPAVRQAMLLLASVGATTGERPLFQSVSDVLREMGWRVEAPHGGQAERERWELLTALVELADRTPAGTTLARFARDLQERQSAQHEPTVAAVTLGTLHGAKGLEWDSVHIVGLSEGLLPVVHARGLEAIDEERRLLYVGITRARRRVSLTWSRGAGRDARGSRDAGGRPRSPSRFLAELSSGSRDAVPRSAR